MNGRNFTEVVDTIVQEDPRYCKEAYNFVRRALDFTLKGLGERAEEKGKHVSGGELLIGIRDYALDQYGPMTMTLFDHWVFESARILERSSSISSITGCLVRPRVIIGRISKEGMISTRPLPSRSCRSGERS